MEGVWLLGLAGGVLIVMVSIWLAKRPGVLLRQRFVRLGQLQGRSKAEIVAHVGPPNSISVRPQGGSLLQWIVPGYHIALDFGANDVCLGVTHEFAAR